MNIRLTIVTALAMRPIRDLFSAILCLAAIILISPLAKAQNLFESDYNSGNVYQFTPSGSQSTFASGLSHPLGLAFDSAGNLFVAEQFTGNSGTSRIDKFTPYGTRTTFASGFNTIEAL